MPALITKLLRNQHAEAEQIVSKLDSVLASQTSITNLLTQMDEALNPNRAVTVYACEGISRTTDPTGTVDVHQDPTEPAEQMFKLNNAGRTAELMDFAKNQVSVKPGWLTPYLFIALAYAQMDDYLSARAALAYFDQHKGPAYDVGGCLQASKLLHSRLDNVPVIK